MAGALPSNWLERVARSLSDHEERRDSLQNFPPRYEVLDEISRGGMGIVYRAWDPQLGRNVALKVLRSEEGNAAEAHERFQREARLAAGLHHPHIVPVYDTGTWNGQDYIAMQLIDGVTLEQAKPDRRTALACIRDAARALQYAHEQGIVHRDVKPSNLMLDAQRRLFIMDFGIARQAVSTSGMTSPGTVVGTPAYMSPEQAQGLPLDARSDVYSLGATLYELVTGRAPYKGEPLDVVEAVRTKDPDSARRLVGDLSKNVAAIISGAMERRAQDRYPTAAALADDIDRYLKGERPHRRPRGLSYKVQREFVRHPWRTAGTILLCLLLLFAGAVGGAILRALWYESKSNQTSDIDLQIDYLSKATILPGVAKRLAELMAKQHPPSANIQVDKNPPREPDPKAPSIDPPRPDPVAAKHAEQVAKSVTSIEEKFQKDQLDDDTAREIDALEKLAPERAPELRTKLRKLRSDSGIRKLKDGVRKAGDSEFRDLFTTLLMPSYTDQKGLSALLAPIAFQRALALAEATKWKETVSWCDEAEKLQFKEAKLYEQRGLALLELQDWIRAEKDLQSLRGYSTPIPKQFAALPYRKERQALLDRNWTEAMSQADAVLLIDPNHALACHDRGLARFGTTGRAQDCLEKDLQKALQSDPSLVPSDEYRNVLLSYCHTQGETFWNQDDPAKREAAWQTTLNWLNRLMEKKFAGDPDLLLERATVRRRMGDLVVALQDAHLALKIRADGSAYLQVGILAFLQGRIPKPDDTKTLEAIASFNEAVRLSPDDYRPLYWRGICRRDLGGKELEACIEDLLLAVKLHPGSPFLDLQLATARVDLMFRDSSTKNWKEAADEAARAVLNAEHLTQEDMVAGFYELRRLSRTQALKLHLKDAHLCRAQAFNQGADYARSVAECSAAVQLDPEFRLGFLWRGFAYFSSRNYKEAEDDFRTAVKLSKDSERKTAEDWLKRTLHFTKGN